jgi:hypothetical protein
VIADPHPQFNPTLEKIGQSFRGLNPDARAAVPDAHMPDIASRIVRKLT